MTASGDAPPRGRLILVPNTLDLGSGPADAPPPDIRAVLPLGALQFAAGLTHWLAENAKSARALLKRIDAVVPLPQPLQSIEIRELPRPPKGGARSRDADPVVWRDLLAPAFMGNDLGLVSEAGLPAVADPGAAVVRAAHDAGVAVVPLAGPSALTLAMAASGLNGQSFAFVGYVPSDEAPRAARLRELEALSRRLGQAQMFIETPYRNAALVSSLLQHLQPATWVSISCGLTLQRGWSRSQRVEAWRRETPSLPADVPAVFVIQAD